MEGNIEKISIELQTDQGNPQKEFLVSNQSTEFAFDLSDFGSEHYFEEVKRVCFLIERVDEGLSIVSLGGLRIEK